ncbi:hypothetical protein KR222_000064, partial [Zaprionus bogoriensis]
PNTCPVGKCSDVIFPSNLMMHMLHKHADAMACEQSTIAAYEHQPIQFYLDPTDFRYGENHCVGIIAFGGVQGQRETEPALNYMSLPNMGLINSEHLYENYLPVMLIACRSSWYAQLQDKHLERQLNMLNGSRAGVYVFWLVASNTTRKLYYTLTAYDRYYHTSRSVIRTVRDYTSSQCPSEFLANDDNYLL